MVKRVARHGFRGDAWNGGDRAARFGKLRADNRYSVLVRLLGGSALLLSLAGHAAAQTQGSGAPDASDLQAQVRSLTALVQQLAHQDQAQITALQAQVQALQSKLDARSEPLASNQPPAPGAQIAEPRAAQNAALYPAPSAGAGPGAAPAQPGGSTVAAVDSGIAQPRVVQNAAGHFALQSPDGRYSIGFAGVVQFDAGDYLNFSPRSRVVGPQELSTGVNSRRARVGVAGTLAGDWSYAFIYDGGNSQDSTAKGIETAQIVYGGFRGVALELGYSNTFFTLDQATSSNDLLFLERASPSNIATAFNTGDNRSNLGVRFFGDRYWLGGYLTGPAVGDSHTNVGERLGAFERGAVQVLKGPDYSLHLGVGVDELIDAPTSGANTPQTLTLSDQPELRIDPTTLLNTGTIGTVAHPIDGGYVLDLETAATWRGLFWQGEYYHYDVGRQGLPSAGFDGAYGQVSWTLTGEAHRYNPQAGAYYRILPTHPFSLKDGGFGAVELAARLSYVDLDSRFDPRVALSADPQAIDGGRQTGVSLGLNWYPNDLLRFMVDYNHVDYVKANGAAVTGAPLGAAVGAKADSLAVRGQVVF